MVSKFKNPFAFLLVMLAIAIAFPVAMVFGQDAGAQTPAPTIKSDLPDYPPGATVTLTGSGWQPGETVNIFVNDDSSATWTRNVDVTADESGNIRDQFNLPAWFVADYSVKATGRSSGLVATTTFTDANLNFKKDGVNEPPSGYTVKYRLYNGSTTCNSSNFQD